LQAFAGLFGEAALHLEFGPQAVQIAADPG
jgi:hypothetical protein